MDQSERENPQDLGPGAGAGETSRQPDAAGNHAGNGNSEVNDLKAEGQVQGEASLPPPAEELLPLPSGTALAAELPLIGTSSPLHFKLSAYDGPLELLLELIKKNEMDIYNIQISEITRQYLESLALMKQLDLEVAGEYIVMAATLIYIKSKMLLPQDNVEEDEEGGDPRAELVRKLLEYQAFKEAAKELGILEDERGKVFTRQLADYYLADLQAEDVEIDTFSANLFDLLSAFQSVLTRAGRVEMHEVFEQEVSIEEKMDEIKSRILGEKKVVFSSLFGNRWSKNVLIATFLAVLEIVRSKFARVAQDRQFGEIIIEKIETFSPPSLQAAEGSEAV